MDLSQSLFSISLVLVSFIPQGLSYVTPRPSPMHCMSSPHGPYTYEYCTNSAIELLYLPFAGPNPKNRYAMSAWKNCRIKTPPTTTANAPECLANGATKVSWNGSQCLHTFDFWQLDMHTGDPWLAHPPADSNSGSQGVNTMKMPGTTKRSVEALSALSTTNMQPGVSHPWADELDKALKNDENIPPAHSGFMTFEFCTKNPTEVEEWLAGNLWSNHWASAAWGMCISSTPKVEGPKATAMCGKGATKLIFVGYDCWRDYAWYSKQGKLLGDPWFSSRIPKDHPNGCALGIHVKPFL